MRHTKAPIILLASIAATIAHAADPVEPAKLLSLDTVIITATRSDTTLFDTPYIAHVVGREDFADRQSARTFPDALREIPGVMLQRTSYGQTSPFIRGFTGFRTLALIDGIRLNNAVFREGPNQYWGTVDPFTIDHIDVVKGPSSVLYGSDAIGGTVNAITRNPIMPDWPGKTDGKKSVVGGPEIHGGVDYRFATAEGSHTVRGEFSVGLNPHFGVIGGLTYKDYDDLRGGDAIGSQTHSGYREVDGDFKFLWRPNQNVDVTLGLQHVQQNNVPRWHSTVFSESFDGTALGTDIRRELDQLRDLAYVRVDAREIAPWISRGSVTLSYQRQSEEQDRIRGDLRRDIDGFQDDTLGFQFHLESPTVIGKLNYGMDYYHDEIQSWGSRWNADGSLRNIKSRGPVADDASYDLLGFYLQDEIKVTDRFTVTPGVRWTWAGIDANKVDPDPTDAVAIDSISDEYDAFAFSLRAQYDLTKEWNVFTGLSQGFRAPNVSDTTSFDIARSGEIETPSNGLSPEYYLSFEFGTKLALHEAGLDFYAAYYKTWIDDQLVRYPTGNIVDGSPEVQRANSGDGYVQGIEAGLSWRLPYGFTFQGNIAWSEGEVGQYDGEHIGVFPASRVQPLTAQLGLLWQSEDAKWWAEGLVTLARQQDRLSLGDQGDTQRIPPGGTRGYAVYTVRAGWKPTEYFQLYAACENITNEDYRIHGSGINEPGTNFVLGTKLTF